MTLELRLQSFDRKGPPAELFEVPKGYAKLDAHLGEK